MFDIIAYFGYYTIVSAFILSAPFLILILFANNRVNVITSGEHNYYFTPFYISTVFLFIKMCTGYDCNNIRNDYKNKIEGIFEIPMFVVYFILSCIIFFVWGMTLLLPINTTALTMPTNIATKATEYLGIWPLFFPVYMFIETYLTKIYQWYKKLDKAITSTEGK